MPKHGGIVYKILLISLLMVAGFCGYGQTLSKSYFPSFQDSTIIAFLGDIEKRTDISLSYSTSQFDAYRLASLPIQSYTIEDALNTILSGYSIELIERSNQKIIITVAENVSVAKDFTVSGVVKDHKSGEKLYGASIYHMGQERGTHANKEGFYSLSHMEKGDVIRVTYIGYRDEFIAIDSHNLDIRLSPDAEVSTVVITEVLSDYINPNTGGDILDFTSSNAKLNILGEKDILHVGRQKAGVYSGSEGLGGLIVRGGSQDQNLMLFENVPMYSVNHMADISSIFMEDAIRDAQLITGGFPSRFSGRLSSVLEVQMKEGNQDKLAGSVSAGLPGFKAFLEGPINNKSSFIVGGRISWINAYIDPIIRELTVFENLDLDFHDFIAKYTYRFNNTSTLTISGYKGGDEVRLDKNQNTFNDNEIFNSEELTRFGWDNDLLSVKYSSVLSDKWYLSAHAGFLDYNYRSKASYDFTTLKENEVIANEKRVVVTSSGIVNALAGLELDYFLNAKHKLKFGGGVNHHRFSPKIEQSQTDTDIEVPEINPDSITLANEFSVFVEDTYTPNKKSQFYLGLNFTKFSVRDVSYSYFQPRLKIAFQPQKGISLNMTGSRMVQFLHLLVNNGLGLPSDLWVPSTDAIRPEISDQFSFTIKVDLDKNILFTVGGFIKQQQNVILYRDPQDLFTAILNDATTDINFINDRDWERRIEVGDRKIAGLEVSLKKTVGDWQYNISYTRSKAENRFDNLNRGNAFADRYDRPHDINISTSYRLNKKWNVGLQWIFGSGNTFTLPLVEVPTTFGQPILTQDQLNNYRMPDYHHLDLLANYDNTIDGKGIKVSFGIYNVYNRYNPYYLYVVKNEVSRENNFKKLSLFPFLPHCNVTYKF